MVYVKCTPIYFVNSDLCMPEIILSYLIQLRKSLAWNRNPPHGLLSLCACSSPVPILTQNSADAFLNHLSTDDWQVSPTKALPELPANSHSGVETPCWSAGRRCCRNQGAIFLRFSFHQQHEQRKSSSQNRQKSLPTAWVEYPAANSISARVSTSVGNPWGSIGEIFPSLRPMWIGYLVGIMTMTMLMVMAQALVQENVWVVLLKEISFDFAWL